MEAGIRISFVRSIVDAAGGETRSLGAALPERLSKLVESDAFQDRTSAAGMAFDDAESLLFGVDRALGNGSGRALEDAAQAVAGRRLTATEGIRPGELMEIVTRLGTILAESFLDPPLVFEVTETSEGFVIIAVVRGLHRSARLLRHLTVGFVRAATTASRPGDTAPRIYAETLDDRARISVHVRDEAIDVAPPRSRAPMSTRPSGQMRAVSVSEEVDRILAGSESKLPEAPSRDASGGTPDVADSITTPDRDSRTRATPGTSPFGSTGTNGDDDNEPR